MKPGTSIVKQFLRRVVLFETEIALLQTLARTSETKKNQMGNFFDHVLNYFAPKKLHVYKST